jgi:arylsulfatase A
MKTHHMRSFLLLVIIIGLVASTHAAEEKKKPNFIIIYTDNLGYGDIEPFGSTVHRTPNLNRMAKEGRKFTHFSGGRGKRSQRAH